MKTIKAANTHVRTYPLRNSDTNQISLPWHAQILGAAYDGPADCVVVTAAWSSDETRRETREFVTSTMDRTRLIPAGVLTHIGTVTVPNGAPVVVFEIGSPEEKRARSIANAVQMPPGSVRINHHAGDVGPGGMLVQGEVLGGVHVGRYRR
jgi:hypothetical protein